MGLNQEVGLGGCSGIEEGVGAEGRKMAEGWAGGKKPPRLGAWPRAEMGSVVAGPHLWRL